MSTLPETCFEIDQAILSPRFILLKYFKTPNTISINVCFVLKHKNRLILSNPNEQVVHEIEELPGTISRDIKWVQDKGLSTSEMRNRLYEIGVTRREIQNLAIKKVESFVDSVVKVHESLSNRPDWHLHRFKVEILLPIYQVYVHRGVVLSERGPKPAGALLAVRDLKRVRVEESTIDADEQCSVCYENFVEQEQLIVLPCEHVFHEDCVSQWLKISNMCPLCRFELPSAQEIETTSTSYRPLRPRRCLSRFFTFLFGGCLAN